MGIGERRSLEEKPTLHLTATYCVLEWPGGLPGAKQNRLERDTVIFSSAARRDENNTRSPEAPHTPSGLKLPAFCGPTGSLPRYYTILSPISPLTQLVEMF